jgi:ligand-binding sensor domain-containing protein
MWRYRFLILFIFFFGTPSEIKAQKRLHYFFRHITEADGLLHNQVYSIAQDGKGFIWIATSNGLQRYDGSRFVYYPDILSNPSEGFTYAADIYVDKKKDLLWIIKNNALEKMDLNDKRFTVYHPKKSLLDSPFIFDSYMGANNEHWLINDKAVYHYDSTTKSNLFNSLTTSSANPNQSSCTAIENGNTWLVSGSKLYLFNKKNKQVYSNNFNPVQHPLLERELDLANKKNFRFIMTDSRQYIWITSWRDKFYKYDDTT